MDLWCNGKHNSFRNYFPKGSKGSSPFRSTSFFSEGWVKWTKPEVSKTSAFGHADSNSAPSAIFHKINCIINDIVKINSKEYYNAIKKIYI